MRTFTLNDKEEAKLRAWDKKHRKTCRMKTSEYSNNPEICFTSTGIGDSVRAICVCKEEINLTDYDSW